MDKNGINQQEQDHEDEFDFDRKKKENNIEGEIKEDIIDTNIPEPEKDILFELYRIYKNKRNVYLHSSIDPSQTKIIEKLSEAQSISDEILYTIKKSYNVIFGGAYERV